MSKKPNIVFVFSDQHNASVMGCEGDPYIKTPNLDKLASKGVRLTNCYSPSPLCVPCRTSLLTGRMPHQTKTYNNFIELSSDEPTMAHSLTIAGYETVLAGRMHFCGHDQYHGFEKHFTYDATPSFHRESTFEGIYGDLITAVKQRKEAIVNSGSGVCGGYLFDEAVTDSTLKFLEEREDDRPLFLTVGYFAPHPPYVAPKELFDYYYENLPEIESDPEFKESLHPAMVEWARSRNVDAIDKETKRRMRAAYYALIEFMDQQTGKILEKVEETLGLENTIIIYASDHGDNMGVNDFYFKTHFFEGSVKVPAIVSHPGEYGENVQVNELTNIMDLTHTILDIAGAKKLPAMHESAESILEVLKGNETVNPDRTIIGELGTYPLATDKPSYMVRTGKWKLVDFYGYETPSLYNLEEDPTEIHDLGKDPQYAELIAELRAKMDPKWKPEEVVEYCQVQFEYFQMVREWADYTKFEFPDLFLVENSFETNYVDQVDIKRK